MRFLSALGITLFLLLSTLAPVASAQLVDTAYDPDSLTLIKPELRADVARNLPAGITEYTIEIDIPGLDANADRFVITGTETVIFTNTFDELLSEIPFRMYANRPGDRADTVSVTSAMIGGKPVVWSAGDDPGVGFVELPTPLAPQERVTIDLVFETVVRLDDADSYGILSHSPATGTTMLAQWYPMVAGVDPETGWMLKPTSIYGDPIFTNVSMYEVTITAPAGLEIITSGIEVSREDSDDSQRVTFSARPSRDFTIVLSDQLIPIRSDFNGVLITSWVLPEHAPGGGAMLAWMVDAFALFEPLLGEYPWIQLNGLEVNVYGAAAVELPQMIIVDTYYYTRWDSESPTYFEFTVVHEVVHQWFYNLVGNNQYDHAFIDEGLTNYLSGDVYFRYQYGEDDGESAVQTFLVKPFERMINGDRDVIVDHPTDDFPNAGAYSSAVYTKAPMGFAAIHEAMGDDGFFTGLRDYVAMFSFHVATPADMEAALASSTTIDLSSLWDHWFHHIAGHEDVDVP